MIRRDLAFPGVGRFWPALAHAGMCMGFLVLLLVATPADAAPREACVDGVNCYCDCVEDTPGNGDNVGGFANSDCQTKGIPIDPNLIWCEDFEDPTYENPNRDFNNWLDLYGTGSSPCTPKNNNDQLESDAQKCRNILQAPTTARPECRRQVNGGLRPNSVAGGFSDFEYDASDPDLRESGTIPGLDGTWDGCQSWAMVNKVGSSGGEPAQIKKGEFSPASTLSFTMMKKYSENHHVGRQQSIAGGNVKGDRYNTAPSIVPMGGRHTLANEADACTRSGSGTENGYPDSNKFPFASLIKRNTNSGSVGCADSTYPDDPGPSGPMIGIVDHAPVSGDNPHAFYMPPRAKWNPGVPGGVPMSTQGDKDGRGEWLCMQVSLANMGTNSMDYKVWVNEQPIMRFENIKHGGSVGPIRDIGWLNLWACGGNCDKPTNTTGMDIYEVRDNYHVSRSATPPSCAQVGFDGLPIPPDDPPPDDPPPDDPPPDDPPPDDPPPDDPPPDDPPPDDPPPDDPPPDDPPPDDPPPDDPPPDDPPPGGDLGQPGQPQLILP